MRANRPACRWVRWPGRDETSLSLAVHVREQTRKISKPRASSMSHSREELVFRMVKELNRPGRAGGGGFYDYPQGAPKVPLPGLKQFEKPGAGGRCRS